MAIEITSRLLALVTTVAFTLVLTTGQLAMIPKGRWTFVVLFGLGLTMCTVAGTRDGVGTALAQPGWLSAIFAAIGISGSVLLIAVLIGLDWRLGVTLLGVQISASWRGRDRAPMQHMLPGQIGAIRGSSEHVRTGLRYAPWSTPKR